VNPLAATDGMRHSNELHGVAEPDTSKRLDDVAHQKHGFFGRAV
jgi:hypothetical protein